MRKKMIAAIAAMTLCLGIGTAASADNPATATRDRLQSRGSIVYQKGDESVRIDSKDLYLLADQIDCLKTALSQQLAEVNTYFTSAGKGVPVISDEKIRVVHSEPSAANAVEPLQVQFDVLLEGIAASQSIPNDVTDYGYREGTALYRAPDGKLMTDGSQEGSEQITVSAATADNLSAGTAAWVNGKLLLGTGADNQAYYSSSNANIVLNLIDIVYSGITRDEYYEVTDYMGNGFSTNAYRVSSNGTTYGKHIGVRSVKFPVWDLESEDRKLLNKITIQRSGKSSAGVGNSRNSNTKYRVYTDDGTLLLDSGTSGVGNIAIDVMTLPISTRYIYVECESKPSASVLVGHYDANCSVTMQDTLKATYLVNH